MKFVRDPIVAAVLLGGGLGAVIGLFAAFYRRLDGILMRCMDVLLSFPAILFGLALAAIFGPGPWRATVCPSCRRQIASPRRQCHPRQQCGWGCIQIVVHVPSGRACSY